MSRRSQAFAEGQPAFTWRLERIAGGPPSADGRYKCTCENHPSIFAFGNTEQEAMQAARERITEAAETANLAATGPGTRYTGDAS